MWPIIGPIFAVVDVALGHFTGRGIIETLLGLPAHEDVTIQMGTPMVDFLITSTLPIATLTTIGAFAIWYAFRPLKGGKGQ